VRGAESTTHESAITKIAARARDRLEKSGIRLRLHWSLGSLRVPCYPRVTAGPGGEAPERLAVRSDAPVAVFPYILSAEGQTLLPLGLDTIPL
jgi:hypothetical protein